MQNINWNDVPEVTNDYPTAGGYIAQITNVTDNEDKSYLLVEWDYAEGPLEGYNSRKYAERGYLPHEAKSCRSYKEKALPFFKMFKVAVEKSNPGYIFNCVPATLVGKYVGVVLAEEEYRKQDGSVKKRLYVHSFRSLDAIRLKDFKIPALKKLPGGATPAGPGVSVGAADFNDITGEDDSDLPF